MWSGSGPVSLNELRLYPKVILLYPGFPVHPMDTAGNGNQVKLVKEQEALCKEDLRRAFDSTLCFGRMEKPILSKIRLQRMRVMAGLWETARQIHES